LKLNIDDLKAVLNKAEELLPEQKAAELEDFKEEIDFPEVLKDLDTLTASIKNGAHRTKEIVKGLRTFSRLDEDALKETDIHENLDSTLLLLQNQIKDRISIEKHYGNIPQIKAFPGPLNQVFMNILANAIQAIEGEGKITITTGLVHSPQSIDDSKNPEIVHSPQSIDHSKNPMDYGLSTMDSKELSTMDSKNNIFISIQDSGKGMSKSVMERIFEPFFTTKDVGKGTGLGLSISHSIIEKHGGKIEVESTPNTGTTFTIILPIHPNNYAKPQALDSIH
ncbi:MAG: ATP-binding protein, partial [Microscillaceae bacterium]|nr:ATP-binding protein [Microscillaceae bacterium]